MKKAEKTEIFESAPIPTAVAKLCIPTVLAAAAVIVLAKMFRRLQNERGV